MDHPESSATVTSLGAEGEAGAEGTWSAVDLQGSDRYALERVIGQGGMGRVLEAQDRQFGRTVAVKQIVADSPQLRQRFMTEARVTATLEHPGVPPVYEMGFDEAGRPFYAMRLMRGRTLAKLLDDASNLEERLAHLGAVVRTAHTLAFAHHRGVVHRDVKPDNILVGDHGETVLLDWGIAKVRGVAPHPTEGDAAGDEGSTRHGAVMGTPAYMAPEQAMGEVSRVDERTDVFALGAILYHVLSGRPPYRADATSSAVEQAKRASCEAIEVVAPNAPAALIQITQRAMHHAPTDRFQSAEELARALELLVTEALAGKKSRALTLFVGASSWMMLVLLLVSALMVWTMMPSLTEVGVGFISVLFTAVVGLVLGIIELRTRGRYRIGPLVLALGIATALGGIAQAITGYVFVMGALAKHASDGETWRSIYASGSYEAFGSVAPGLALGSVLIVLWAIGARTSQTR